MQIDCFYSSSAGNLYRLDDGHSKILIECGVLIKQIKQALDFKLHEIQACLISHSHKDHCKAVKDILRAGIDCWMSSETASDLRLAAAGGFKRMAPLEKQQIASWTVLPFETEHDCEGSLGFLLKSGPEKVLFLTDSYFCRYTFRGLTHVMIECNYSKKTLAPDLDPAVKKRLIRSHFSLENVKKFLVVNDLSRVREIHLLHLSEGNSDAEMFKSEIEKLTGKPTYVAQPSPC